ncbi:MAG: chemotaxis protein CheC [bacterium]|nr:chemotaxis protein CheC [bacterium]MCS7308771.1 chemotaxis protein CheC [Armatimonadota bacterium]
MGVQPQHTFTEEQFDAMREIANIGMGKASAALADLVGTTILINVPQAVYTPIHTLPNILRDPEQTTAGIYLQVTGDLFGHATFIFEEQSAHRLAAMLLGQTEVHLDEVTASALMEIGNIMLSAYLTAISDFTGLQLLPSPPVMAVDMGCAILNTIIANMQYLDDYAVTIATDIYDPGGLISGTFVFLPEPGGISRILAAIGMG